MLIVEDHAGMRRLLRRAVDKIALQTFECPDGADALAAYTLHRPDVVLMDIAMPGMDGLGATRQIKKFHPAARVLIVTDYDDEEVRIAAFAAGASGYLLKQDLVSLEELIRKSLATTRSKG